MCTFWNRSLLFFALLAPAMAPATPLESGFERGAFSAAGSFRAVASAGAMPGRAPHAHQPQTGTMLAASLGLLGLIALRRLRARRAV